MSRRLRLLAGVGALLVSMPAAHAAVSPTSTLDGARGDKGARTITYVGTVIDRADLASLGAGGAGSWFPAFDAAQVSSGPTGGHAVDRLPRWVAAFNHTTSPAEPGCTEAGAIDRGCLPTYLFRTFSQDGPARATGGLAPVRLPGGEIGASGAIVDPQTHLGGEPNNNNTINRIQLQDGVPDAFYVGVLTDNTYGVYEPSRIELRGAVGLVDIPKEVADHQVEASFPTPLVLVPNGVPDLVVFRVDHFVSGDYLKLRIRGRSGPGSFGGLVFDVEAVG